MFHLRWKVAVKQGQHGVDDVETAVQNELGSTMADRLFDILIVKTKTFPFISFFQMLWTEQGF